MNHYNVKTSDKNLTIPLISLNVLYSKMPKTTGCDQCESVNGDKKDWCCKINSPSMYYVEFLNVWKDVQNTWSKIKKSSLIMRAIKNYLSNKRDKGCIFYDNGCQTYSKRPLACHFYGVISEDSWNKRVKKIRNRDGEEVNIQNQCHLVSFENGKKSMTEDEENKWFKHTVDCESQIGVTPDLLKLHDLPGGTYRTFHDHLLIELFDPSILEMLTKVRLQNPSEEDIQQTSELIQQNLNAT